LNGVTSAATNPQNQNQMHGPDDESDDEDEYVPENA